MFLFLAWIIIYTYLQIITLLTLTIALIAFLDAYAFIYNSSNVKYLQEPYLIVTPTESPLITLLTLCFRRLVFEIICYYIQMGSLKPKFKLTYKIILQRIIFNILGINKIFILLTVICIKIFNQPSLITFLTRKFFLGRPARKIIYVNKNWYIDNSKYFNIH